MRTAIVTASYRGDLDRCRLLCDSIDRHVTGHTRHLILVEERDRAVFAPLAGPRREIVGERDLLPFWLRPFPDPTTFGRRRVWLSPLGPPLRGWHAQQLRRIAMATRMPEEVMLSCDSDVVFVKPFAVDALRDGKAVRFHRAAGPGHAVLPRFLEEHRLWARKADALLGIAAQGAPEDVDYVATAIAWRTDTVRAMTARIEAVTSRSWMAALASTRALSECTIYGRFVDAVERRPDLHVPSPRSACRVYWDGKPLDEAGLAEFVGSLGPEEAAIGVQSFTGTGLDLIRRVAGLDRAPAAGGAPTGRAASRA